MVFAIITHKQMVGVIAHVSDSSMHLQLIKQLFLVILFVIITKAFIKIILVTVLDRTSMCSLLN